MEERSVLTVLIEFRDRVYAKFDEYDAKWAANDLRCLENDARWAQNDARLARLDDRLTGRIDAVAAELHEFRVETNVRLERLEGRRYPRALESVRLEWSFDKFRMTRTVTGSTGIHAALWIKN